MNISAYKHQRGATLIISLVILLVLTMLSVQAMQTATLEEKMAGNFRDKKMAFEAAEEALRYGEMWLNRLNVPPVANATATNGVFTFGSADISSSTFWSTLTALPATNPVMPTSQLLVLEQGLAAAPQFVIEERGVQALAGKQRSAEAGAMSKSAFEGTTYGYRIIARGVGGTNNASVILQSDFNKIY